MKIHRLYAFALRSTFPPANPSRNVSRTLFRRFSSRSRGVLARLAPALDIILGDNTGYFITLTVAEQNNPDAFYTGNLSRLLENYRKQGIISHYVWRAERQRRGAIHFHILCFGTRPDAVALMRYWAGRVGGKRSSSGILYNYQKIIKVDSIGVVNYLSKYISKLPKGSSDSFYRARTFGVSRKLRSTAYTLLVDYQNFKPSFHKEVFTEYFHGVVYKNHPFMQALFDECLHSYLSPSVDRSVWKFQDWVYNCFPLLVPLPF